MPRKKKRKRFDIGKYWKGRKQPESVKKKRSKTVLSLYKQGKWKPWNKGKKLSKKHREKLRKSNLLTYQNSKLRKKMSMIKKRQYKKNPELKKRISKSVKKWRKSYDKKREKQSS